MHHKWEKSPSPYSLHSFIWLDPEWPAKTAISPCSSTRGIFPAGTPAPQQQKFHTDNDTSVLNLVSSSDLLMWWLSYFSYCFRMIDKRRMVTKVKCKCNESTTKQSIFVEYKLFSLAEAFEFCWSLFA